jgi:diguanylate cyclase (GGDEF)-like protein
MLLIAPPILLYSQGSGSRMRPKQLLEGAIVTCVVLAVGIIVFFHVPVAMRGMPNELFCTPVLLWAAFRLGRRIASAAILLLAAISIFGTLQGHGPFLSATPFASLVVVLSFLAITSTMTMSLAALASEYSVAEAQLRELVVTDPLTGLPNYRRLLEVLGTEIARANRYKQQFAVVFFDMDGLKRINDEHGHLTGSRAVCRLAETLRAACRTTDTAARYGGDEFVTVLSETDLEGARVVVRRVDERLADDPDQPSLSVSAGIAIYPRDGGTPTTLLSAADRALYAVKAEKSTARRRAAVGIREVSVGSR